MRPKRQATSRISAHVPEPIVKARKPSASRRRQTKWDRDAVFASLKLPRFADLVQNKESEIIVAAFQCIGEVGIAATTTRVVARRAQLNQGLIHYYFRSKDALLLGAMKSLMSYKAN